MEERCYGIVERKRKSFTGVINIIKFNKHFYITAALSIVLLIGMVSFTETEYADYFFTVSAFIFALTISSLAVSYYVYDVSDLYTCNWIENKGSGELFVNIVAGYDETTPILKSIFPDKKVHTLDFYTSIPNLEVSLKRARFYTQEGHESYAVAYHNLEMDENIADKVFVIFSAHELRKDDDKILLMKEVYRVLKPEGELYIVEHLRDFANFCAYTIGFFHFFSKRTWMNVFEQASLTVKNELKVTPFVSVFILKKNGNSI